MPSRSFTAFWKIKSYSKKWFDRKGSTLWLVCCLKISVKLIFYAKTFTSEGGWNWNLQIWTKMKFDGSFFHQFYKGYFLLFFDHNWAFYWSQQSWGKQTSLFHLSYNIKAKFISVFFHGLISLPGLLGAFWGLVGVLVIVQIIKSPGKFLDQFKHIFVKKIKI